MTNAKSLTAVVVAAVITISFVSNVMAYGSRNPDRRGNGQFSPLLSGPSSSSMKMSGRAPRTTTKGRKKSELEKCMCECKEAEKTRQEEAKKLREEERRRAKEQQEIEAAYYKWEHSAYNPPNRTLCGTYGDGSFYQKQA